MCCLPRARPVPASRDTASSINMCRLQLPVGRFQHRCVSRNQSPSSRTMVT
uniref:Uncharacterized protein n=1 Tax=Triticum urartu TaxID=4572 RepID=A0A8R7JZA0_TRIUA